MQHFDFQGIKQTLLLLLCASFLMIPRPIFAQLENVRKFGYQLQNINISEIKNSDFDLIVLDYSSDGSEANEFTPAQIDSIKKSGKLVISYLSIGEAETYRFYWREKWDADGDGS